MVFLVTSWYGSFIFHDDGSLDMMILFENKVDSIASKLASIDNKEILSEEKELAANHSHIIVNQKRLRRIGHYQPTHPFFTNVIKRIQPYAYPDDLLRQASIYQAKYKINEQLHLPDFQIIQKINTIDDLQHASNMIDERLQTWKIFSMKPENLTSMKELKQMMISNITMFQDEVKEETTILAPNTSALIGPILAARLLTHAGSMKKLSTLPASSIQLLGAEKALFRFKKEGGKPPKHGVLFQHESLLKAPKRLKGKIARLLSLKIILAVRADVFTKRDIGTQLKKSFEDEVTEVLKDTGKQRKHK